MCFFLLEPSVKLPGDVLIRRALLLAASYRFHCQHRRGAPFSDEEVFRRAGIPGPWLLDKRPGVLVGGALTAVKAIYIDNFGA